VRSFGGPGEPVSDPIAELNRRRQIPIVVPDRGLVAIDVDPRWVHWRELAGPVKAGVPRASEPMGQHRGQQ
jgi:hypothetical protein